MLNNKNFEIKKIVEHVKELLDKDKAIDIIEIDLKESSSFADIMIIATASNARLVKAISSHIVEVLKGFDVMPKVEGYNQSDWVLIDAGDLIVNIFRPEVREFYKIEKIWSVYSGNINTEEFSKLDP